MYLISIIVPIYNVESYLRQCIDSILNQTYRNLEIILVDDGSPDNCPHICDEYAMKDSRIKVIHKKNGGLGAARNSGLEIATGDFIGFVDSDDYISPKMYESLIKAFREDIGVVSCNILWNKNGNYEPFYKSKTLNNLDNTTILPSKLQHLFLVEDNIEHMVWNKLYRFNVIEGINFIENRNDEDTIFFYEISKKLITLNLSLERISGYYYYWRFLQNSISNSKRSPIVLDLILNYHDILCDIKENNSTYYFEFKSKIIKLIVENYGRIFDNIYLYRKYSEFLIPLLKKIPFNKFIENYSFIVKIKVLIYLILIELFPFSHKYLIKHNDHKKKVSDLEI